MVKKNDRIEPLPVAGYTPQPKSTIELVNDNKALEEQTLRRLEQLGESHGADGRWLAIGRTHIEQAFMAINRSLFKPERVKLPEDLGAEPEKIS